jgi:formylglycine-generating enzyme required for sulfatase activity
VASALLLEIGACRDTLVLGERSGSVSGAATGGSATGGQPASGGTNTLTGGSAGSPHSCPGTGGPAMVWLPQGYCIDSTEVTMRQYQDWLDSSPPTTVQTGPCTDNGFVLNTECLADVYGGAGFDDFPVVCVDWCDAYAYCRSVGKRLCGSIDGGSVPIDYATYADVSQWHNACVSDGAKNFYAYGVGYQPDACNGCYDPDVGLTCTGDETAVPVASMQSCQSSAPGYGGVFDLSGNVWEWEDSCSELNSVLSCAIRGGSFRDGSLDCINVVMAPFDGPSSNIGFRCCAP